MSLIEQVDGALVRQAAKYVSAIRKAISGSVNVDEVITSFMNTHPLNTSLTSQQTRAWAKTHIQVDSSGLTSVVADIYRVGALLGQASARAQYARAKVAKDAAPFDYGSALAVNWDNWTPGNVQAADLLFQKGGLQKLFDRNINRRLFIKDADATTLDRIGTILSEGISLGSTGDAVAREFMRSGILDLLDNPARAVAIANTEMARAVSVASMDTYTELGVEQVEWIGVEPCDICQANEAASPMPIGQEFPSGDTEPPGHTNCRCALGPVIEGFTPTKTITPDVTKGVPGPLEIERALSRLAILPNPTDVTMENREDYIESPWEVVSVPTIDPNAWDKAEMTLIPMSELKATDSYMKRKNIKKHIKNMGQAMTGYRSDALVVVKDGVSIIIDGHHRLFAKWLLGQDTAPVWKVDI